MDKRAIICVDDEAIILLSLKQELKTHFRDKFLVETALNADVAFKVIEKLEKSGFKIIIIISDWLMPGMRGDEFLIKINEKYPEIIEILITGQADEQSIKNLIEKINLQHVIRKPWYPNEIINIIEKLLSKVVE
ncbi:MAG: hypothetical protein A2086_14370 [Spirochaetes bacterium GWD1_27_9]|nr:MAG: hypothetical protein A2Z98_14435 [Spirochaetes bacterium GWB1_27_13]OHD26089.1 MAG: hypothetical protein A2Y34_03690 [Spirochaetes bacterium GWC1_27_15]OHD41262.1 MAG: hypothetical protein A2086_14370 [Spirochaetes bacterium GWD1_27_9]